MIGNEIVDVDFFNPTHSPAAKARELARQLLIQSAGQPVFVVFEKKDGSVRPLRGRVGVADYLVDPINGDPQAADSPDMVTVFDDDALGYRSVTIDRILALDACGVRLQVRA